MEGADHPKVIVEQAGTVAEASRAVGNLKPDLVILDVRMAGGIGIEGLEGIKMPIIMLRSMLSGEGRVRWRILWGLRGIRSWRIRRVGSGRPRSQAR